MANKYLPHVLVLPEDDANADLVNGFMLHHALKPRAIQVLPCAGGWPKVRKIFIDKYISLMKRLPERRIVLLIDFDKNETRFEHFLSAVPDELRDRVFIIGTWKDAEAVSGYDLGSRETVGYKLAEECFSDKRELWNHEQLKCNASELARMTDLIKTIVF